MATKKRAPRVIEDLQLLTAVEVAQLYAVSLDTITNWVERDPTFPRPVRLAGMAAPRRFLEAEIKAHLKKRLAAR